MSIKEQFFSTRGAVGRSEWAVSLLAVYGFLIAFESALVLVLKTLARITGFGRAPGDTMFFAMATGLDRLPGALYGGDLFTSFVRVYFGPILILVSTYAIVCLVAQRCRDRNHGAFLMVLFPLALLVPLAVHKAAWFAAISGLGRSLQQFLAEPLVSAAMAGLFIWAVVDLALLRRRT